MTKQVISIGLLFLCLGSTVAWSADSQTANPSVTSRTPVVDRENQNPLPVKAVSPQAEQIPWISINDGGALDMSSTNYKLGITIGQTAIGYGNGASHDMGLGYWYGACVARAGDANASNTYTLGDVISIVNYIFNKPGCAPLPLCWLTGLLCRGDWNASNSVTLGDAIQAVNYIFSKPGGPWNALPIGSCCLP